VLSEQGIREPGAPMDDQRNPAGFALISRVMSSIVFQGASARTARTRE